ncbi:3-dehydroquinate dehydratase [Nitrosopumilaceae archaeon]|nr:type I 3-dehydroquinate dehydratase [Nitrosopumilus sp.]CAI9832707.1 3-dehydroquinate dehydratase [Nitrosopumilaceae archaeon]MDA7944688.1 type I 3-dehydroquinate dehydratase [Nitrosopumilus sp.]MDA7954553.1 type I 3-dehydroquinate dehydratase [Nitrosopumilus sp.]MDA7959240.1 type I 3-dehydroquinate dehydratase [Nitrosopumilus sp.]
MKYRTCVPVAERTPGAASRQLDLALGASDYAELRLDYIAPSRVAEALELAAGRLGRTVCTLRPRSEGGRFAGSEEARLRLLEEAAGFDPFLLDVEYSALSSRRGLARRLGGARLLVSWHDFGGTPGAAALAGRRKRMSRFGGLAKMACMARSTADAARMLGIYGGRDRRLVAFAMGDPGRISRILCMHLGSPFTYASLSRPTAPGQMSVAEVAALGGAVAP